MTENLKSDDKSIRSYVLNEVLEKVPIDKSYKNLCKEIGKYAIAFYDFQYWYYRFLSGKSDLDFDRSSEPEPLQFSDLPLDVVGLIVNKLKLVDRLSLRKVCRPLRDFIEQQNNVRDCIHITCSTDLIHFFCDGEDILYAKDSRALKDYRYEWNLREASKIIGDNYESEAFNDLRWILKNPKLKLFAFSVYFFKECLNSEQNQELVKCYNNIEKVLKSLKNQFTVRNFDIRSVNPDNILAILPYLKPETLEKIGIDGRSASKDWKDAGNLRTIEQIMSLDQWKQANQLSLREAMNLFPDEVFTNFKRYYIRKHSVSGSELIRLKNMFAASPVFEHCYIDVHDGFKGGDDDVRVSRHMIPNSDKLLILKEFKFGDIVIAKKTREDQ